MTTGGRAASGERCRPMWVWALMMSTVVAAGSLGMPALAQAPGTTQPVQATRGFNIPPQSLTDGLTRFGQQSGWQVSVHGDLVDGVSTAGVSGTMTPQQALDRLLAGTGFAYTISDGNTVTLQKLPASTSGAVTLPPVQVEGQAAPSSTAVLGNLPPAYAGGQVASGAQLGMLGNRDVMDTPFSQTSYTNQRMLDSQARNLKDVFDDNPSIRNTNPDGSAAESFIIRGFGSADTDVLLNGMPGLAPVSSISPDLAERVEVLNGPGALLNGMPPSGAVGGSINVITKHAGDEPLTRFTAGYASQSQFGGHFDVSRRFGQDNACGARFSGAYSDGNTAVDHNRIGRGVAALGLDCRTDRVRVSLDLGYQNVQTDGVNRFVNVPSGIPVPSAPHADRLYVPTWLNNTVEDHYALLRGEYDILDNVTAYGAVGGHQDNDDFVFAFPRITDTKGDYTATISRYRYHYDDISAQGGLRATAQTGWMEHSFDFNGSYLDRTLYTGMTTGASIASNLYNPLAVARQYLASPTVNKSSDTQLWGFGIADTMSVLNKRVQLTLGVRRQQIDVGSFSTTGAPSSQYSTGVWSPAFATVFKPWQNVSLYANYIEGLQQGAIVGAGYANANQVLPPYVSKQYETGIKVDWGQFTTTLALFQITQPSAVADTSTNIYGVDGEQRNRGIELNTFGEVARGVRLLGGVTFMDGVQTKTASGANNGKNATGVPHVQLNFGGEWDTPFVPGLTLTGRMIYTRSQYISADNTQKIPSWERFDIGARYKIDRPHWKPMTLRFDIENVANKNYWETASSSYIGLGAPRTYLLSLTTDF